MAAAIADVYAMSGCVDLLYLGGLGESIYVLLGIRCFSSRRSFNPL